MNSLKMMNDTIMKMNLTVMLNLDSIEKDSYEGEEAEMDELNKRRSTKHAKNPLVDKAIGVLKVGAIAVAAVSVVATTSTVHEHHIPNDWTTIVDATCIEYGKEEKRCDDCGKVIDARLINYGEHLAGD